MPFSATPHRKRAGVSPHSATDAAPQLGELKAVGRYPLRRLIARGGMSEVYLGVDPTTGNHVAVKLLARELCSTPSYVDRFIYEGRMSRLLTHRNLVRGLESGIDPTIGRHFLVLQYINGPSAQQRLENEGKLPVGEALRIILDIAHALEFLHHKGFVHRDIKPGNILLAPNGSAKLADLGVAKYLRGATELTTLDAGVGTPYYMPWEQTLNSSLVEPRSDLFALGATLYHLVTGEVPFPGTSEAMIAELKRVGEYRPARELDPSLPPELDAILRKLLVKDHIKRYTDARELIEVLTASGLKDGELSEVESTDAISDDTPTRLDLENASKTPIETEAGWILRYKVQGGGMKQVRGRTHEVRTWIEEGLLPEHTHAARDGQKRFRRLRDYPEFRSESETIPIPVKPAVPTRKPVSRARIEAEPPMTIAQIGLLCVAGFVSVTISALALYCLLIRG